MLSSEAASVLDFLMQIPPLPVEYALRLGPAKLLDIFIDEASEPYEKQIAAEFTANRQECEQRIGAILGLY